MQYTLTGGIKYRKKRYKEQPCPDFVPNEVSIFLKDATPITNVGELVKKGAPIAKNDEGFTIYASITGEVTSLDDGFITIAVKEKETETDEITLLPEYTGELNAESRADLARYLLAAGHPDSAEMDIRRDFGNTKRVILNCISSPDPKDAERIIDGAKIILLSIGIRSAVVAISKKDTKFARAIEKCKYDRNMFLIAMLPVSHPLESPVALRSALIPSANDDNCFVLSTSSCIAAYEAAAERKPFIGHNIRVIYKSSSYHIFCPLGTMVKDIKEYFAPILQRDAEALSICTGISGIGISLSDSTVIGDDITALTITKKIISCSEKPPVCIACGKCSKVCPRKLSPYLLYKKSTESSISDCISCACCSAACPVGIPLAETITKLRWEAYNEN